MSRRHSDDRRLRGEAADPRGWRAHHSYPYLKVQWWRAEVVAWQDLQRVFGSEEEARACAAAELPGRRCRLMQVHRDGRAPLPGSEFQT
jgi:hypothetical protein